MRTNPLYPSIPPGAKALTRQFSKAKTASETHQSIEQQIEAFLKSGKHIQEIPRGVTGLPRVSAGRVQIHIGNKGISTL